MLLLGIFRSFKDVLGSGVSSKKGFGIVSQLKYF
jgi:hypothetical protein